MAGGGGAVRWWEEATGVEHLGGLGGLAVVAGIVNDDKYTRGLFLFLFFQKRTCQELSPVFFLSLHFFLVNE